MTLILVSRSAEDTAAMQREVSGGSLHLQSDEEIGHISFEMNNAVIYL